MPDEGDCIGVLNGRLLADRSRQLAINVFQGLQALGGRLRREIEQSLDPLTGQRPERLFTVRSAVTALVILATVVVYAAGGSLSFTALGGFALLLVVHRREPETVWERIDWSVLVFFGALFVAVDAFARSGAATWAFTRFPLVGSSPGLAEWLRAAAIFLVGSNVVTNVPFILIVEVFVFIQIVIVLVVVILIIVVFVVGKGGGAGDFIFRE